MDRLSGKVAVITGAALGIGRAIATRMAQEGATVALLDLHDDVGRDLAADLTRADRKRATGGATSAARRPSAPCCRRWSPPMGAWTC